jgi:soluble lytic murein transglycosylase-like protein
VDPRSGKLIRSVVVSPKVIQAKVVGERVVASQPVNPLIPGARPAAAQAEIAPVGEIITRTAREYNVDPLLVHAVIQVESNYNPYAISRKGAEGLMQLIPSTARRFGVRNSFNVEENIRGGVKYLRYLQDTFKDDRLALAAYNAGEAAVMKYNWIPPYPETQSYVYQVGKRYGEARRTAPKPPAAAKPEPTPAAKEAAEPVHRPVEAFLDSEGKLHLRTK